MQVAATGTQVGVKARQEVKAAVVVAGAKGVVAEQVMAEEEAKAAEEVMAAALRVEMAAAEEWNLTRTTGMP